MSDQLSAVASRMDGPGLKTPDGHASKAHFGEHAEQLGEADPGPECTAAG